MLPRALPLVLALVVAGCVTPASTPDAPAALDPERTVPGVRVETDLGNMTLLLYPERLPATTANFLGYVADGFYDGRVFERVVDNFVIQSEDREGDPQDTVPLETHPDVHFAAGVLGMARNLEEDSATHVFFVTEYPQPHLHEEEGSTLVYGTFAGFGQLVSGWDVLRAIAAQPTRAPPEGERPVHDVTIRAITAVDLAAAEDHADQYPRQVAGRTTVQPYRVSLEHQHVLRASTPVKHFAWFVESTLDRSEDTGLALVMRVTGPDGDARDVPLTPDPADGNVHRAPADFAFPAAGAYRVSVALPPHGLEAELVVDVR